MSADFDPRTTPARPDLAAVRLRGQVMAGRYAEGVTYMCAVAAAPIRRQPGEHAMMDDQLLFGDVMDVYDIEAGWAWGQSRTDDYVGYVRADHLVPDTAAPTHFVSALRAYAFVKPDLKSQPLKLLSMNCRVAVEGQREGDFVFVPDAGWIWQGWLSPLDGPRPSDHATIAGRFLGSPYLWGGKESLGLDCSGLVQMALTACGIACPRDTDMQEAAIGVRIGVNDALTGLKRGDLVFWKGHVGIMLDAERLIHANAHHMETAIEPLAETRDRIAAKGIPISAIKRLG